MRSRWATSRFAFCLWTGRTRGPCRVEASWRWQSSWKRCAAKASNSRSAAPRSSRARSTDGSTSRLRRPPHVAPGCEPGHGSLRSRQTGSLVADRRGRTTAHALLSLQERGTLFVSPGLEVYEGMIIGESPRPEDMDVNPTREKKQTNMRSSTAEATEKLPPPITQSLEQALEFIRQDECLEVTPAAVRT